MLTSEIMKVAFFSAKPYDRAFFDRHNQERQHELNYFEAALNQQTVNLAKGHEAVCVFVNDKLDAEIIKALSKAGVRLIALRCAGYNNVDLSAAAEAGIQVVRVPLYSPQAVAEHAVALILTLNRKTHKAYNRVREHNFSLENLLGFDLYGKTVGVIGTGNIGKVFCRIMCGFGCRVLAQDVQESEEVRRLGVRYTDIEELLRQSDIVSLHCPLTPETQHLINKDRYALMKDGVMLINTSRGAIIHTKDTIQALKTHKLGYLGIDVYEQEENLFFRDLSESIIQDEQISRLMTFPNVLITAHQGFFTKEALTQIATTTLQSLSRFEKGEELEHEVKPQ